MQNDQSYEAPVCVYVWECVVYIVLYFLSFYTSAYFKHFVFSSIYSN